MHLFENRSVLEIPDVPKSETKPGEDEDDDEEEADNVESPEPKRDSSFLVQFHSQSKEDTLMQRRKAQEERNLREFILETGGTTKFRFFHAVLQGYGMTEVAFGSWWGWKMRRKQGYLDACVPLAVGTVAYTAGTGLSEYDFEMCSGGFALNTLFFIRSAARFRRIRAVEMTARLVGMGVFAYCAAQAASFRFGRCVELDYFLGKRELPPPPPQEPYIR